MNDDDFDSIFDNSTNLDTDVTDTIQTEEAPAPEVTEVEAEEASPVTDHTNDQSPAITPDHEPEDKREGGPVPLSTFLDMRDRMKSAEKRAEEHQRQLEEYQNSRQTAVTVPDPLQDPTGYARHTEQAIEAKFFNHVLQWSHQNALRTHDKGEVDAAVDWAQKQAETDPRFDAAVLQQADPVNWAIEQHKAAQKTELFYRDPDEYVRQRAMEMGLMSAPITPAANTAPAITTKAGKVRPSSLTDVPAAIGKTTPQSETESFDSIFNIR